MLLGTPHAETPPPTPALADLEAAGLASKGRLRPEAAALVAVMTESTLVVSVEKHAADGSTRSTAWANDAAAVWGRPVLNEVYELRPVDRLQLALLIAQLVGVGRRPPPPFSGGVTVPIDPLEASLGWRSTDPETALAILVAAGVEPIWADRLLIAHDHARSEWSVSSVWSGAGGSHHVGELAVLDAGPGGYWEIRRMSDAGTARYMVMSLEETMRRLRACLPDELDLGRR